MTDETPDVKLARIDERLHGMYAQIKETRADVHAIKDRLDEDSPRWILVRERVDMHHKILAAMMVPVLGAIGLAVWNVVRQAKP